MHFAYQIAESSSDLKAKMCDMLEIDWLVDVYLLVQSSHCFSF